MGNSREWTSDHRMLPKKSTEAPREGTHLRPTGTNPIGGRIKAGRTGVIADGTLRGLTIPGPTCLRSVRVLRKKEFGLVDHKTQWTRGASDAVRIR